MIFIVVLVLINLYHLNMAEIQLLKSLIYERLAVAACEIFDSVEKPIVESQGEVSRCKEENDRLRRLLDIRFQPEIKLHRTGKTRGVKLYFILR